MCKRNFAEQGTMVQSELKQCHENEQLNGHSYGFEPGAAIRLNTEGRFWSEVTPTLRANMGDNQIAVVRIFDERGNNPQ